MDLQPTVTVFYLKEVSLIYFSYIFKTSLG